MSAGEIIEALPRLTPEERAKVRARLDELAGDAWLDAGEVSDADKQFLESELADYERSPDAGDPWHEVKARVETKLGQ